ncbi:MAG TPA: protein kinase, partial [Candidatus Eisenbacteria bacterium]|nr:protein kinase [Candidatus Eisenbacteria bacterium]
AELARLGLQIAEAIASAHERGIVHRDLSAKNLILSPEGRLKIVDFGLARFTQASSETASTETMTASIAGTLPYMSPEQLLGRADARSDIYGVGALLYQMATGRLPFAGLEGASLVAAIHTQAPPPPTRFNPRLSSRMQDVLLKCLEKDPDRRYQGARELAVDLKRILEPWPFPPVRRHRLATAVAVVVLVTAAVAITLELGRPGGNGDRRFQNPQLAAVVAGPGKESGSRISSDQQWISFLAERDGKSTLWRRHMSGGEAEVVTSVPGNILSHAWSPAGHEIAYLELLDGDVFLNFMSAFGGPPSRMIPMNTELKDAQDAQILRWIGPRIYFEVRGNGLWCLDTKEGKSARLIDRPSPAGRREQFDVSPDETQIVYVIREAARSHLWISDLDGGNPRRISAPENNDYQPRWAGSGEVMFTSDRGGQPDIWWQAAEDTPSRQVTFSSLAEDLEDVATDGSIVTYTQESEAGGLWRSDRHAERGRGDQLTSGAPLDLWPVCRNGVLVYQRWKPGMEGSANVFDHPIYVARLAPGESLLEPRLVVQKGGLPTLSPDGRFVTYIREPSRNGFELWLHDVYAHQNRIVTANFAAPDLSVQPLSVRDVNQAWSSSGDTLFVSGFIDQAPVVWRYDLRGDRTEPEILFKGDKQSRVTDLFVSPYGTHLAFLLAHLMPGPTGEESMRWEAHVQNLVTGVDSICYVEEAKKLRSFMVRGWSGSSGVLAVRIGINADWTHRLEFLEVGNGHRTLGSVDNAYAGTLQYDPDEKRIYLIREDAVSRATNICAFDIERGELQQITDNRSPSVTFGGMDLEGTDTILYSMIEHNQDIWMVQFEREGRSRKEKRS